jgi:hypothetical protein
MRHAAASESTYANLVPSTRAQGVGEPGAIATTATGTTSSKNYTIPASTRDTSEKL